MRPAANSDRWPVDAPARPSTIIARAGGRVKPACRERSRDPEPASQSGVDARYIAGFTIVRAWAGDREALDEYAAWVRAIEPGTIEHTWREVLEPLRTHPEHKAIAEAARAMFLDPKSSRSPLVPVEERPARR